MMSAIAQGLLEPSAKAREHLDHCLSCQACEAACPAGVPYLQLMDHYRAAEPARGHRRAAVINHLLTSRSWRGVLRALLRIARALRPTLLRLSRRLQRPGLLRLLSLTPQHLSPAAGQRDAGADLQLLTGCIGDLGNAAAIEAFQRCCQALGLRVDLLPATHCCGALSSHLGATRQAEAVQNRLRAQRRPELPLVALDTACASQLIDRQWPAVEEACSFLARQDWSTVRLKPLHQNVVIHQPCSQRHGLHSPDTARQLLQKIPELQLESLQDPLCCGAAGLHMLNFPQRADALLQTKLQQAGAADWLSTNNVGCALHFAGGFRRQALQQAGQTPTVAHPLELIARQIDG